jgi:5-methylcytosine-specific restriction endonuclease McrA
MTETAIGPMRACTKCGVEKPHTRECFHTYTGKAQGGRLAGVCRECWRAHERAYAKARYEKKRESILANMRRYRVEKPDLVAKWDAKRGDRSDYNRQRKKALWAAMSPEEREAKYARLKAWKRANPDKVAAVTKRTYEKHKAERDAYRLQWRRDNPDAASAIRDRRRAKEMGAEGSYTKDDIRALLKSQGRFCRYCKTPLTKFHVDHFIPLSRGGTNWPHNLVLACASCNCSKADKMPWDWRPDLFEKP